MKYVVTVNNGGTDWYLRSTIWTAERGRADLFNTPEEAHASLDRAKKFMLKPSVAKLATVKPVEGAS
jgi:hypothetical protein